MDDFNPDLKFWLTAVVAALLKVIWSPTFSIARAFSTVAAAIFCAWVFTEPAISYLELDIDTYKAPVAAVLAIMGETIMRWLTNLTPDRIIKILRGQDASSK